MSLQVISITYPCPLKIVTYACLIQFEHTALSMTCLLGNFFGQVKPFVFIHPLCVQLPMSELEMHRF